MWSHFKGFNSFNYWNVFLKAIWIGFGNQHKVENLPSVFQALSSTIRIRKLLHFISTCSFTDDTIPPASCEYMCIHTFISNCTQPRFLVWVCLFYIFSERKGGWEFIAVKVQFLLCLWGVPAHRSSLARQTTTCQNQQARGRQGIFSSPAENLVWEQQIACPED